MTSETSNGSITTSTGTDTDGTDGTYSTRGTGVTETSDGTDGTKCNVNVGATGGTNTVHVGVTNASVGIYGTNAMDGSYATDRNDFTPFFGKGTDSFKSASKRSTSFHITSFAKLTTLSSGADLLATDKTLSLAQTHV